MWTQTQHRDYCRKWRLKHPDKCRLYTAKWKAKNPSYFTKHSRKRYWKNPEKFRLLAKDSRTRRKLDPEREERHKRWMSNYIKTKKQTDAQFKLATIFRRRLLLALKVPGYKSAPSAKLLGCSIDAYKRYLESKWLPGMTWDNHGKGQGKWHIDHVRPCASFDLRLSSHQSECFHFSNTQPLWEMDNYKKGSKCVPA